MFPPVIPIQPNTQTTLLPVNAFAGIKTERTQDMQRRVVDRKKETAAAREEVPREEAEDAAVKLNRLMGLIDKHWEFTFEDRDGNVVVRIVDQDSGEKLGDITPQRLMEMLNSFNVAAGMFFDTQV